MKKLTFIITLLLVFGLTFSSLAMFPDVPEDHWAYEEIQELKAEGILIGFPVPGEDFTEFKGDREYTRYEMALVTHRMLNKLDERLEEDVEDVKTVIAEVKEEMKAEIEDLKGLSEGLTPEEAQEVLEIANSLIKKQSVERIQDLKDEFEDHLSTLETEIQEEIATLAAEEDLQELSEELNTKIEEAIQRIEELEEEELARIISDVNETVGELKTLIEDNKENIENIDDRLGIIEEGDLDSRIDELEVRVSNLADGLDKLEDRIEELEEIDEDVSALEERVIALEDRPIRLTAPGFTYNSSVEAVRADENVNQFYNPLAARDVREQLTDYDDYDGLWALALRQELGFDFAVETPNFDTDIEFGLKNEDIRGGHVEIFSRFDAEITADNFTASLNKKYKEQPDFGLSVSREVFGINTSFGYKDTHDNGRDTVRSLMADFDLNALNARAKVDYSEGDFDNTLTVLYTPDNLKAGVKFTTVDAENEDKHAEIYDVELGLLSYFRAGVQHYANHNKYDGDRTTIISSDFNIDIEDRFNIMGVIYPYTYFGYKMTGNGDNGDLNIGVGTDLEYEITDNIDAGLGLEYFNDLDDNDIIRLVSSVSVGF